MDDAILFQIISIASISAALLTFNAGAFLLDLKKEYLDRIIYPSNPKNQIYRKVIKNTKIWIIIIFSTFIISEVTLILFRISNESTLFFLLSQIFFYFGIVALGLTSYDLIKIIPYL